LKLVGRIALAALAEGVPLRIKYPPFDVMLVRLGEDIFALEDACNHAGASLAEGPIRGCTIACPLHGYVFDLKSGALLRPRKLCDDQRTFQIVREGEDIVVWDPFDIVVETR
jgi:3-phenylpropionate/trans-cinnamate dioxygenase ferredoxin subunit